MNYNKALQILYQSVLEDTFKLNIKAIKTVQGQVVKGLMDNPLHCGSLRQHVIFHPFIDGNGRTTRLLTTSISGKTGLDLFEIFSFENYYNHNIMGYFKAVGLEGDYYDLKDEIDFSDWLEYFADGMLDELCRIIKLLPEQLATKPRLEPQHKEIVDYIQERGRVNMATYRHEARHHAN